MSQEKILVVDDDKDEDTEPEKVRPKRKLPEVAAAKDKYVELSKLNKHCDKLSIDLESNQREVILLTEQVNLKEVSLNDLNRIIEILDINIEEWYEGI